MLGAIFLILGCKVREDFLVSVPLLDDVAVRSEDGADAQVELVLRGHVQLQLELASFTDDVVAVDGSVGFFFSNKGFKLLTCFD